MLKKHRHSTTDPDVYPGAKIPQMSLFRRDLYCVAYKLEANTEVQLDFPALPKP